MRFFRSYTSKVWGIPPNQIQADWGGAAHPEPVARQGDLERARARQHHCLIEEFSYPRLGPGMTWEKVAGLVGAKGGSVQLQSEAVRVVHKGTGSRRSRSAT